MGGTPTLVAGRARHLLAERATRSLLAGEWLGPVLLVAGLACALAFTHQDDMDAATYTVLARNLAADGLSFHLRFTPPGAYFFEHPPLWLWLLGAAARIAPALPLGLLSTACVLGTFWCARAVGLRTVGSAATRLGLVLLALNVPFALQHALPRLDAPLTLCFTASVALLASAARRPGRLLAGGLVAGIGFLVKGPPAMGAPVAAALLLLGLGRRDELADRRWLLVLAGAALPAAAFLAFDRLALGGEWATGYLDHQVLASLDGRRTSQLGHGPLYLLSAGLWARARLLAPLALLALPRVVRRRDARRGPRIGLLLWICVLVAGFGVASRAYWFYVLPAFVPLALLAGAGLEDALDRVRCGLASRAGRIAAAMAAVAGVTLLVIGPAGALRALGDRCPYGDLPALAATAARGGVVAVVTTSEDFASVPLVAEHGRCDAERFPGADALSTRPEVTVALAPRTTALDPPWRAASSSDAWTLWLRGGEAP
jgi:4-amino-4-deoxy-L-arabinose transferase-like glycosyltransferase